MIWPYAMYPLSTWWSDICVAGFVLKSKTESVDKLADSQSAHWGTKRGTLDYAHGLHPRKTHARDSFAASRDEVIIVRSPYEGKDFTTKTWFWALLHLINLVLESKWRSCSDLQASSGFLVVQLPSSPAWTAARFSTLGSRHRVLNHATAIEVSTAKGFGRLFHVIAPMCHLSIVFFEWLTLCIRGNCLWSCFWAVYLIFCTPRRRARGWH